MKSTTRSLRKLRAESLESRQLLHGGGLVYGPLPATAMAESAFTRRGINDDTVLAAKDGIAERVWGRLAGADTDGNGGSQAERISHSESRLAERSARRADRLDAAFERLDKNDDGSVTADEVPSRRWERISEAAGSDEAVTQEELREHLELKRAERQAGNRGTRLAARAAAGQESPMGSRLSNVFQRVRSLGRFRISQTERTSHIESRLAERSARRVDRLDAAFERLDKNDDESVTADEVSSRRWEHISEAAGSDEAVTQEELREHVELKRAERQAGNGGTRAEAREARAARQEARREARAEAAQAEMPIGSRLSNVIQRFRGLSGFRR